ncbi:MAG TPA: Hpt domain-containing protein [Gemmatimonadaceae bacterium]|jgi:HPt (histidine-containing phosphotransfer) domain-containing protein
MHETPPVAAEDFDALLELLDAPTMREVVRLFMASAPERLVTAQLGLQGGDLAITATAFHAMRSGCGQLGARQLEAICAHGERRAKSGDHEGAAADLAAAEEEFARCRKWFSANGWLSA